ncbi:efflux RND transporter periplasmic adaptor subunit [Puniceicoccaceae bacterium K14]|nr:efflux RND transporter periplasmic adaptor subunit [Puniceicoccaceae bacterium K14]
MKFTTILKIFVPIVLLAVFVFFAIETVKPEAVVVKVERTDAVKSVSGTVRVLTGKTMQLRSAESGRVIETKVDVGRAVQEGEMLAQLDTEDVDLEIEKAQIDLDAAKKLAALGSQHKHSLAAKKEDLEDLERMLELGSASLSSVNAKKRDVKLTEENIERESANVEKSIQGLENFIRVLERRKEKMRIESPISGVVSEVYAFKGDLLEAGNPIALVISDDRVVEVRISEENFTGIAEGQRVRVKFLGYGSSEFNGAVSKVLPVADPDTQRYAVHVDLSVEDNLLFPGLTGEANIVVDQRENALVLPATAVRGSYVFTVKDGIVEVVEVKKGYENMVSVEILSGVEEGTHVIVEDLDAFRDGDRVKTSIKEL